MPAGRPYEYTSEILEKAQEYLDSCEDKEVIGKVGEKIALKLKVKLPSIEGLARHLGIHRPTFYEWLSNMQNFRTF